MVFPPPPGTMALELVPWLETRLSARFNQVVRGPLFSAVHFFG
jgi:hypothetical protein